VNARLLDRLALGLAIGSLALIGLRPSTTREVDPSIVVVATPGASRADARAVADSLGGTVATSLSELGGHLTSATRLHLVGWGLDAGELRRVGDAQLTLHPRPLPAGIRRVEWPVRLELGEPLVVQLTIGGSRGGKVVLSDRSGPVDSAAVPRGEASSVTLRHTPSATGSELYTISWQGTVDSFSVAVSDARAPTTLILSSAPSRDWSDLRDWLAAQGGSVTLRSQMSRDRIGSDRVNSSSDAKVDRASLARVDLVVTDGRTLVALTSAERAALLRAVDEGLGVVILLDGPSRARRTAGEREFFPWRQEGAGEIEVRDVRPERESVRFSATPISAEPYTLVGGSTVLEDGQGGVLVSTVRRGRGRITGSVVTGAGRWTRGGEPTAYAGYWSALFRATARPDLTSVRWELPGRPIRLDDEIEITRWGGGDPVATIGGDTIAFARDPLLPERELATWWPRAAGWNEGSGVRVWVSGSEAWPSRQGAERRRATEARIADQRGATAGRDKIPERAPWPLWPFFVLFVGSCGWLWRRIGD
jgi:hypothetical protein